MSADRGFQVEVGLASRAGASGRNEDACGARIPKSEWELRTKGVAAVLADGVRNCANGAKASAYCVQIFLQDYFDTPETWGVRIAAERVLRALNAWLYGQGLRCHGEEGAWLAACSVIVIRGTQAHLFHVGDIGVWCWRKGRLEQITCPHRTAAGTLLRAMGAEEETKIEHHVLATQREDRWVLATDGLYEAISEETMAEIVSRADSAQKAAEELVAAAQRAGTRDDASCIVLHVLAAEPLSASDHWIGLQALPVPPLLRPGMEIDGLYVRGILHEGIESIVYLVQNAAGELMALKTIPPDLASDLSARWRLAREEWIGRRVQHEHLMKILPPPDGRSFLYFLSEYIPGRTLQAWLQESDRIELNEVRAVVHQIVRALRAFHRREMVYLDLNLNNAKIDESGAIKLLDYGCVFIAGLDFEDALGGTPGFLAPEVVRGNRPSPQSDMFSLGAVAYALLSGGHLPYGETNEHRPIAEQDYIPLRTWRQDVPRWVDEAIRRAVHPNPAQRYASFSEFEQDLSTPNPELISSHQPLLERDPLRFWKLLSLFLLLANLALLFFLLGK